MADILVLIVALLHTAFMIIEMAAWPKLAKKVAGLSDEAAMQTKPLGFNQGLYNGFLAAGLFLGVFGPLTADAGRTLQAFILICVIVAGCGGAWSLKRPMFLLVQSLPAALALAFLW